MIRLLLVVVACLWATGCNGRQINPGAIVPIRLVDRSEMPHPDWGGAFIYDDKKMLIEIKLVKRENVKQQTAILLHEFCHLIDHLTGGDEKVRGHLQRALQMVCGDGFETDWQGSRHQAGVSW